jgi:hypothetical protein
MDEGVAPEARGLGPDALREVVRSVVDLGNPASSWVHILEHCDVPSSSAGLQTAGACRVLVCRYLLMNWVVMLQTFRELLPPGQMRWK